MAGLTGFEPKSASGTLSSRSIIVCYNWPFNMLRPSVRPGAEVQVVRSAN